MLLDLPAVYAERTGTPKGLVLLNGEEWAQRRKPTQEKMLRPAVVANYVPLLEKVTNDFVEILRKKEKIDDLQKELSKYSTESVGMLCFNKRMGCLESDSDNSLAANVSRALEVLQESLCMPVKTFMFFRTEAYKRFEKESKDFRRVSNREIMSQRAFLTDLEKKGQLEEYLEKEPNFMYSLLADGRMTDDQINSMINDLFAAGIDSTTVAINMKSMTIDGRFFPEPNKFIPERWLRDTTGDLAKGQQYPFATKPFGFGPRSCIGQRFAENDIFIAVSKLIQNFEVSMPAGVTEIKTTMKTFTTPTDKVTLHLKARQKDQI